MKRPRGRQLRIGAPQALTYVPDAVPSGDGTQNLVPLGMAGQATHLAMAAPGNKSSAPTSVTLFNQGLVQIVEAAVTGLTPQQHSSWRSPQNRMARARSNRSCPS
jgi:hypothetical protein